MAQYLRLFIAGLCLALAAPALAQDYTAGGWNPAEPGTGDSLEVQDVPGKDYDLAYMVWYLYDEAGQNTWYSSIMQVYGERMDGILVEYDGWPLEEGVVTDVVPREIGSVSINFISAKKAYFFCKIAGASYLKTIELKDQHYTFLLERLNGFWWDEAKPGMGWFMDARDKVCFAGWYNFRADTARTGGSPRWRISLDSDFQKNQESFSQPLLEYSGGQTCTGEYKEPSFTILENLDFTIPERPSAIPQPPHIELTYAGNVYHLTPFQIPDVAMPGFCPPAEATLSPESRSMNYTLRPAITAHVKTSCNAPIDNDSIVMKLNDEIVSPSVINPTSDSAEIIYTPEEDLEEFQRHWAEVVFVDANGETATFRWSFHVRTESY